MSRQEKPRWVKIERGKYSINVPGGRLIATHSRKERGQPTEYDVMFVPPKGSPFGVAIIPNNGDLRKSQIDYFPGEERILEYKEYLGEDHKGDMTERVRKFLNTALEKLERLASFQE